jgi:hypothetical protein
LVDASASTPQAAGKETILRHFRCYFLDAGGHIVLPADVEADDIETAKQLAFDIFQKNLPTARVRLKGLEVWEQSVCVFRSGPLTQTV